MGVFDGLKEILLSADPGSGVNPDPGYIFKWIQKVGIDYLYKYKDENGVVGNIGSSGAASTFDWMLQGGNSNLPSNGTESGFSYGHNNANDGVCMMRDGFVKGLSVYLEGANTSGSAKFIITINSVDNDVLGQRILIDGSSNAEGGIDGNKGYIVFAVPLAYSAGDQIEIRAITSGWNPTAADCTVLSHMEDTL